LGVNICSETADCAMFLVTCKSQQLM